MRLSLRHALLAAASLSLAGLVTAQTPLSGYPFLSDCATPVDNLAAGEAAELYAVKLAGAPTYTDWLVDTTTKGGASTGLAQLSSLGWLVPSNWTAPEAGTDRAFVYITYSGGRLAVDSGEMTATAGSFNLEITQAVGNWLPSTALAGRGVNLTSGGQYALNLGSGSKSFPFGANGAVMLAFAPVVEVNNTDPTGSGCAWGGEVPVAGLTGNAVGQGGIAGYNVYRLGGTAGAPPTAAAIGAAANWAYYIDLRTMNIASGADLPGSGPPGDGTDAPNDSAPDNDLGGLDNDNGTAYDGDEVVIFSDQTSNPDGSARVGGVAGPTPGQGYWYAFQPCVGGTVTAFTSVGFAGAAAADHRLDLDGDTMMDAVDLDGVVASPEFISPQAEQGLAGLGLTHAGAPLISVPVFGQINPAAAGGVDLTALLQGSNVNISFTSAIEGGNVLGFNVFRVEAGARTQVNTELIAARGGEGSVYSLVDKAEGTSRRVRRDATVQYELDVVYNDGTATRTVGPFAVTVERGESTRRAR